MIDRGMLRIDYGPKVDYDLCVGCGRCYDDCPMDVFGWDEEQEKPIVAYPGECRFCVACELGCTEKAIDVRHPLHVRIDFGVYPVHWA